MYMKKHSPLTPFIAHGIRKMTEIGIKSALAKRHIVPEPNCQPIHAEGIPLGVEKFASLFAMYSVGCFVSLFILVMENLFKPSRPTETNNARLMIKIDAIKKELQSFSDDIEMQLFLLNEVKRVYLRK